MGNGKRLTPLEFSKYLRIDVVTVYRWLKLKQVFGSFKVGGRWFVDLEAFEKHYKIYTGEPNANLNAVNVFTPLPVVKRPRR